MKKASKILGVLILIIVGLLIWYKLSRSFYCLDDNKCITVWKTSKGCYIIFRKYYGIRKPNDNFIKTTNTNAITLLSPKSSIDSFVLSNDYGQKIEIGTTSHKIKYFNSEERDLFVNSFFENNVIKSNYNYIMIDIKEELVIVNGIKK